MLFSARGSKLLKLVILVLVIGILAYAASSISAFIHLFFEHAGTAITQGQVIDAHSTAGSDSRVPTVPRIIHQTFHNWGNADDETVPSDWNATRQTCIDFNPGWENWVSSNLLFA